MNDAACVPFLQWALPRLDRRWEGYRKVRRQGGHQGGRRRPFPDDVARALADESNLRHLESFDIEDRGLRDIWEVLVTTGRRCSEVLEVRLECIGRLNKIPLFWHDQTKVGNYDEGIRIPERLFQRIQLRQEKTAARFHQRHGRELRPSLDRSGHRRAPSPDAAEALPGREGHRPAPPRAREAHRPGRRRAGRGVGHVPLRER
jgi:hypothetical protein